MKSQLAIHLLAASLASGSMLSRMRSTGCAGASDPRALTRGRVLDNIDPLAENARPMGRTAKSDNVRWIKSRLLHINLSALALATAENPRHRDFEIVA